MDPYEAAAWSNDEGFLGWLEGTGAIVIATELKVCHTSHLCRALVFIAAGGMYGAELIGHHSFSCQRALSSN